MQANSLHRKLDLTADQRKGGKKDDHSPWKGASKDYMDELTVAMHRCCIAGKTETSPFRYGVQSLNMNLNTKDYKKGDRPHRKKLLNQLFAEFSASLVFVQEPLWLHLFRHIDRRQFAYEGRDYEAGIMFDERHFDLVHSYPADYVTERNASKLLEDDRGRLFMARFSPKISPNSNLTSEIPEFLAASWHGPSRESTRKPELFVDLLRFLQMEVSTSPRRFNAFILGGDFNLKFSEALKLLDDSFPGVCMVKADGEGGGYMAMLDYFVFSRLLMVGNCQAMSWEVGSRDEFCAAQDRGIAAEFAVQPERMFDHRPVYGEMDLGIRRE